MKNADAIKEFFKNEKQQIIDTNGAYTRKFLKHVSDLSNKLNVCLTDQEYRSKQACFKIYTGYNGHSYRTEDEWFIIAEGVKYKYGYYYDWDRDERKTETAEKPLILHGRRTGYSGILKTPTWYYEVVNDNNLNSTMLMLVTHKNEVFDYWVSNICQRILNARVNYMKDNNLFDMDAANKLSVKYGVDKKPNDWFEWARKYVPMFIEAGIHFRCMAGWYGGVEDFYKDKKTGKYMVSTYMTNDHSDGCGDSFILSEFLQERKLSYSENCSNDPYRCDIRISDKEKMFEEMFETV